MIFSHAAIIVDGSWWPGAQFRWKEHHYNAQALMGRVKLPDLSQARSSIAPAGRLVYAGFMSCCYAAFMPLLFPPTYMGYRYGQR